MGYHSLAAARKDTSSYLMGYYNQERPHAFNGGIAPVVAEEKLKTVSGISQLTTTQCAKEASIIPKGGSRLN